MLCVNVLSPLPHLPHHHLLPHLPHPPPLFPSQPKCAQYWPEVDPLLFGDLMVEAREVTMFPTYILRKFSLSNVGGALHLLGGGLLSTATHAGFNRSEARSGPVPLYILARLRSTVDALRHASLCKGCSF